MCKILEKSNLIPDNDKSDASVFTLDDVLAAIELYLEQVRDSFSSNQLITSVIGTNTLPSPPSFPNSNVTFFLDDILIEEEIQEEEEPYIVLSKPGPIEDI